MKGWTTEWNGSTAAWLIRGLIVTLLAGWPTGVAAATTQARADEVVGIAMELMGGEAALRAVDRVSLSMMTQWQRTGFREIPGTDLPSFERHYDVRDYTIPAWRNTRDFGARKLINIIRDSVASSDFGDGPRPLSIAYVDEREELFTYTPDRLLLKLVDAPDLTLGPDTLLAGEPHHRVSARLSGRFPSEVFFHAVSGAPTLLRFRAGHPNDFGLVPWGEMEVEVWYNNWRSFGDVAIPTQWDVFRVGRPYKRMTVRAAVFNPEFAADSFVVSDDLRAAYQASETLPMHQTRALDGVEVEDGIALTSGGFGAPMGAVNVGDGWLMVGAGQTGWNLERAVESFEEAGIDRFVGVVAGEAVTGNGGVAAAAAMGWPIYTSPSAEAFVRAVLSAEGLSGDVQVVQRALHVGAGDQQLLLEPFSMPDAPWSMLAWHAASGWLFVPDARDGLGIRLAMAHARQRGWEVRWIGGLRQMKAPAPAG